MHVALPRLPAPTGRRAATGYVKTTKNRAVKDVGEESNVDAVVGEASVGTAESTPVVVAKAEDKITKGEEEATAKVEKMLWAGCIPEGRLRPGDEFPILRGALCTTIA